jgi:Stealth protein CR2, conserved region 2/Stealth protein CR1, conserved region 1
MSYRRSDDSKSKRTCLNSWRPSRLGRLRRPLFFAFFAVCFFVWHHSRSAQLPILSQNVSLDRSSFQSSEYDTPPNANVPHSVTNAQQRAAEEDRRREIRQQEAHLEADRLLEIQTIERHLKEHHQIPGYKPSEADDSDTLETEEDRQLEEQKIQKHLEEEHAEHRQLELLHQADDLANEAQQHVPQTAPQGSEKAPTLTVIEAELDPETQKEPVITSSDQPQEPIIIESESQAHLSLEEKADLLPEVMHIPFEDAVRNVTLEGWEDEWVANASFDSKKWGKLKEPKIDFVYLWVNGSEKEFQDTKRPYELNSVLNDVEGTWIKSHGRNRYRDWDELRYSLRSIEKFARNFRNKIQILVNSVNGTEDGKQIPWWLNAEQSTYETVQVLAQEEFFDQEKHVCLPTFNSLTMENQIFNTPSNVDHVRHSHTFTSTGDILMMPSFLPSPMICSLESRIPHPTSIPHSSVLSWASSRMPTTPSTPQQRLTPTASVKR